MSKSFYLIVVALLMSKCTKAPDSCFTYSPSHINAGNVVTFNANCSKNASYFEWNFGDGTADTNVANTHTIHHVYKTPGSYKVILNAKQKGGVTSRKGTPESSIVIVVQ